MLSQSRLKHVIQIGGLSFFITKQMEGAGYVMCTCDGKQFNTYNGKPMIKKKSQMGLHRAYIYMYMNIPSVK